MDKISEAAPLCFIKNDDSQPPQYHGLEVPKATGLVMYFVIRAVAMKLFKVKLKFQSTDLKRTFPICWYMSSMGQLPAVTLGTGWPHEVGTAEPLAAEPRDRHIITSRLELEFHLTSLTGATGLRNNKQIHGVVFVKDKGLSLSLMLYEGSGRHSNQPPQIVSVPRTSSHISLIWSCRFDTLSFTWWQSFEDTRKAIRVCSDFIDMSYVSTYVLYLHLKNLNS